MSTVRRIASGATLAASMAALGCNERLPDGGESDGSTSELDTLGETTGDGDGDGDGFLDPLCPAFTAWADEFDHVYSSGATDTWPRIATQGDRVFVWTGEHQPEVDVFRVYDLDGELKLDGELPPFEADFSGKRQAKMMGMGADGFGLLTWGFFPGVELTRVGADGAHLWSRWIDADGKYPDAGTMSLDPDGHLVVVTTDYTGTQAFVLTPDGEDVDQVDLAWDTTKGNEGIEVVFNADGHAFSRYPSPYSTDYTIEWGPSLETPAFSLEMRSRGHFGPLASGAWFWQKKKLSVGVYELRQIGINGAVSAPLEVVPTTDWLINVLVVRDRIVVAGRAGYDHGRAASVESFDFNGERQTESLWAVPSGWPLEAFFTDAAIDQEGCVVLVAAADTVDGGEKVRVERRAP